MPVTTHTPPTKGDILSLVSVAEMKTSLRISHTKEDSFIETCILAAYDWLSGDHGWLRRRILPVSTAYTLSAFTDPIVLPGEDVQGVTSVRYLLDGDYETVATSVYDVVPAGRWGSQIVLRPGQSWPTTIDESPDAVSIAYTAGIASAATIKSNHTALIRAIMILAGDYFRNREDTYTDIRVVEINRTIINDVKRTAGGYKRYMVA